MDRLDLCGSLKADEKVAGYIPIYVHTLQSLFFRLFWLLPDFWLLVISLYAIGKIRANSSETTIPVKPTIASSGVQDLSPSASVSPDIFTNIQNPLSFIHEPIIEPPPMAVARYAG